MFRIIRVIAATAAAAALVFAPAASAATPSTFYLQLKSGGCYSFTAVAKSAYSMDHTNKTLYQTSCTAKHHIQVIKAGTVSGTGELDNTQMGTYCSAAYVATFHKNPPSAIKAGSLYLQWYYPDPGAEYLKFGRKAICFVLQSNYNYTQYSLLSKKF